MTDKQIIIDGVDVSGCEFLVDRFSERTDYCCNKSVVLFKCCNNPDCYYKQLKAKEQECEELKIYIESNEQQVKEVETLVMDNNRLINELDQLKAELEQETALKETYLACYKTKHEDIEGELFKLRQYKKSKQASYEALQKKCNELELGIRKLQKQFGIEILYCKATGESTFRSTEILKLKQTLAEIKEIAKIKQKQSVFVGETVFGQILQKISEVLDEDDATPKEHWLFKEDIE